MYVSVADAAFYDMETGCLYRIRLISKHVRDRKCRPTVRNQRPEFSGIVDLACDLRGRGIRLCAHAGAWFAVVIFSVSFGSSSPPQAVIDSISMNDKRMQNAFFITMIQLLHFFASMAHPYFSCFSSRIENIDPAQIIAMARNSAATIRFFIPALPPVRIFHWYRRRSFCCFRFRSLPSAVSPWYGYTGHAGRSESDCS